MPPKRRKTSHASRSPVPPPPQSTSLSLPPRPTFTLPSPNLTLTGHTSSVYTLSFSPTAPDTSLSSPLLLATGGFDKRLLLWSLSERNVDNYNVLEGFKNAITQTSWFTPTLLASSSADRGVHLHDANTGSRIRKYTSHNSVVNCVVGDGGSNLVVSGGDDRFVMLHDVRSRDCVARIKHGYQVLAVDIDESRMWTGGVDNVIRGFEIRALTSGSGVDHKPVITLGGHNDSVTGLKVGLGGTRLVSNGMDGCVKSWDISPYVTSENSRLRWSNGTEVKHDSEKRLLRCTMSEDGGLVTGGSSDRNVHVMDGDTGEGKFLLPGHEGAVTDVQFNGGVIGSAGVDRNVLVGVL